VIIATFAGFMALAVVSVQAAALAGRSGRGLDLPTLHDLDFVKGQLARLPTRAYVSRMALIATGGVLALIASVALMLVR
jgi:hypothetical protein